MKTKAKISGMLMVIIGLCAIALMAASCDNYKSGKRQPAQTESAELFVVTLNQTIIDSVSPTKIDTMMQETLYFVYAKDKFDCDRMFNDSVYQGLNPNTDRSYKIEKANCLNKPFKYIIQNGGNEGIQSNELSGAFIRNHGISANQQSISKTNGFLEKRPKGSGKKKGGCVIGVAGDGFSGSVARKCGGGKRGGGKHMLPAVLLS